MFKCGVFVLLTIIVCVKCDEDVIKDEEGKVGRAMREDFGADQWKAVQEQPLDTKPWVSSDDKDNQESSVEVQPQKRRRLRKRKRRPQIITDGDTEIPVRPRRRRPIRLDQRESWHELEAESPKRPYIRRRVGPFYQPENQAGTVSATLKFGNAEENIEKPEVDEDRVRRRKLRTTTTSPTTVQDIKALLKQSGGLSLSEVLQQRNLSLSDLLKGKQQAILALTDKPINNRDVLEVSDNPTTKVTTPKIENTPDYNNAIEEQRKRLSEMYSNQQNKIYTDVTKYDVVTEVTTDKRIFVPSHPKYYTSLDYRPEITLVELTTEKLTTTNTPETTPAPTTTTEGTTKIIKALRENIISQKPSRPKLKLPITSARLQETTKKQQIDDGYPKLPPNAFKININELFGLSQIENDTRPKVDASLKVDAGPLKMSFDLEELVKQSEFENVVETTSKPETTVTTTTTQRIVTTRLTTPKRIQNKLKIITAKDEIMEMLEDDKSKDRLSKILERRNMTVAELVEQRERGSSQRHLADIFHNKTKEPEPTVHHVIEQKVEVPTPERKPKNQPIPRLDFANTLPDVSMSSEEIFSSDHIQGTSFPTYKIETNKRPKEPPLHIPVWKTVYPSAYDNAHKDLQKEIPNIEIIENSLAEAANESPNLFNKNNYDYDDYIQLPIGVKSAIFASLAIIGISLVVFLTILVIFRWSQRHKRRLCYGGSFSCSKIKSPILQVDPKRSLRSFMSETLGRKKSVYATHLQSMSDSWDSNKPYQ